MTSDISDVSTYRSKKNNNNNPTIFTKSASSQGEGRPRRGCIIRMQINPKGKLSHWTVGEEGNPLDKDTDDEFIVLHLLAMATCM